MTHMECTEAHSEKKFQHCQTCALREVQADLGRLFQVQQKCIDMSLEIGANLRRLSLLVRDTQVTDTGKLCGDEE